MSWSDGILGTDTYRYLPASSSLLPSAMRLAGMATDAGFSEYRRRLVGLGAALVTATRM